jgi:hypothetical protein
MYIYITYIYMYNMQYMYVNVFLISYIGNSSRDAIVPVGLIKASALRSWPDTTGGPKDRSR